MSQLPPQLDIYKASAGSGKTFLLTIKYLQLLFESPKNYQRILAVTFTNKATAEMKGRILQELEKLAKGEPTEYSKQLLQKLPAETPETLQQKAGNVYSAILHDYSRFSVTTIDSFVQKVIRSFAYEIGLDAGFKINLNTELVKEDLAERLFRLLDTDENLRKWVTELAVRRLSEGKSWNFREDMLGLASEIFKDSFQQFEESIGNMPDVDAAFKGLRNKVFQLKNDFETRFKKAGKEAVALLEANGLTIYDFPYKGSGFANFFYKASRGEIAAPGTRVRDVMADINKMHTKPRNAIVVSIETALYQLLSSLCRQCDDELTLYNTALLLGTNVGNLRLMHVFSEELKNYRSQNKELLISDTHVLLRKLTAETDASFIYEKTGNRFHHFLMDEFQDTSTLQWENFKPLLENSLGEGHYNLMVGDVKQAIYRWRGGDRRLLQQTVKDKLKAFNVRQDSLKENHRSTKPVIEFNNFLFAVLPALLQQKIDKLINGADPSVQSRLLRDGYNSFIADAYNESYQLIPEKASQHGQVKIHFLEDAEETYDEQMLPLLYTHIITLLNEGFSANDIGILTRNNREAAKVINYLSQQQQDEGVIRFDILSADALLLAANNAVSLIIRAMEYLSGNGGKLALASLRHLVAEQKQQPASYYHRFICKEDEELILPPLFSIQTEALKKLPLPQLVSELIGLFDLHTNIFDAAYLLALQDMVGEWSRYGNDGIHSFLQYWEDEGSTKSLEAGANANAIQVMTIHKSKGLDFNILLIPYLNWEMKPSSNKGMQVWINTTGTPFNDVPVVPVRYSSNMELTLFGYEYFRELMDTIIDNLNLLYVATTRARRRILGWAPKPKNADNLNTISELLYNAATKSEPINTNEKVLDIAAIKNGFDAETAIWNYGIDEYSVESKILPEPELLPSPAPSNWKTRLTVQVKTLQTAEEKDQQLPRQSGVLLHDAIARLTTPSGVDAVVRQMHQLGLITPLQQAQVKQVLSNVLEQPVFASWINGTMQRLSEREILTGRGELRRPDLVLYNNEKTVVVDFKFTEDRAQHKRYEKQVKEYKELLQQTGFKNISGWLLYSGNAVEVLEVR
jgi:ATP-dependent exoDNAse (exonuclease V) beta subunit